MKKFVAVLVTAAVLLTGAPGIAEAEGPTVFWVEGEVPDQVAALYWETQRMWCAPGDQLGKPFAVWVCESAVFGSFGPIENYPTAGAALPSS